MPKTPKNTSLFLERLNWNSIGSMIALMNQGVSIRNSNLM
jgi:hypothetical protein